MYKQSFSQLKTIIIVDSKNKLPLVNVSVYNLSKKTFQFSDDNGRINPYKSLGDTLQLYLTGYESLMLITPQLADTIQLKNLTIQLETITVSSFKRKKKFGALSTNKTGSICYDQASERATKIFIKNNKKPYKLTAVFLYGEFKKNYELPTFCKLRLYNVNEFGLHGKEITDTPIILSRPIFKKKRTVIDLRKENIILTDSSIIIGVEFGITKPDYGENSRLVNFPENCILRLFSKNLTEFFSNKPNLGFYRILVGPRKWINEINGNAVAPFAAGVEILQ